MPIGKQEGRLQALYARTSAAVDLPPAISKIPQMATSNYKQLRVWQNGMELVRRVYRLTRGFPKHEVFGLSSQMQRAAISVPANIAEGHTRGTTKEFLRYVTISHGSLAELETMFLVARDLQYIDAEHFVQLASLCDSTGKMLGALRRALVKKLHSRNLPTKAVPKSPNP
jgi:four helix bundle protein